MIISDILTANAISRGGWPALRFGDRTLSFAELDDRVGRLRSVLVELAPPGARVGILAPNCIAYAETMYAAPSAGLALTLLNYRLNPSEWAWVLQDAEVSVLLVAERFAEQVMDIRAEIPTLSHVIVIGDTHFPETLGYDDALASAIPSERRADIIGTDTAFLIYTSGTTGFPKGAMISHQALSDAMLVNVVETDVHSGDRHLMAYPMCHASGFQLFVAHLRSGEFTLMEAFDPDQFLRMVEQQRITRTSLAPTMASFVLDSEEFKGADVSSVRILSYGGMPMPPSTAQRLAERFANLGTGFGQSESTFLVTGLTPDDHRRALAGEPGLLASCGRPFGATAVQIMDDDSSPMPTGEIGELCVRSSYNMTGYWNRPEATEAALVNGWLHTGDLARCDDEGYVYIVDRKKDMVISGGLNIYPAEVERVLNAMDQIAEVAVVGVTDPVWGERLVAAVVPRSGAALAADEVIGFAREHLGGYKMPRQIVFVDELAKTVTGKFQKHAIRSALAATLDSVSNK